MTDPNLLRESLEDVVRRYAEAMRDRDCDSVFIARALVRATILQCANHLDAASDPYAEWVAGVLRRAVEEKEPKP